MYYGATSTSGGVVPATLEDVLAVNRQSQLDAARAAAMAVSDAAAGGCTSAAVAGRAGATWTPVDPVAVLAPSAPPSHAAIPAKHLIQRQGDQRQGGFAANQGSTRGQSLGAPPHVAMSQFDAWEQFGKMAQAAMAPKVETQTVMLTERSARRMLGALDDLREEQGLKKVCRVDAADACTPEGRGGTHDWLKQVMTGGGLKAPDGEAYAALVGGGDLGASGVGGSGSGADEWSIPADVRGNDEWEKNPERRPKPRVPPTVPGGGPFASTRMSLPVYQFRHELLRGIDANRVTIVEGDTGCGKTTQVPQYVLEDAAARGEPVYVMCTQPRRISAMGVAARVAEERGEEVGRTVGYSIRLETKAGPETQLMFCTTGVLLRRMETDPLLSTVSHVFIDEVHERGVESDFLLMTLRDVMRRNTRLKLCLMSATMDANLFSGYFHGAPTFSVPGRTFSVTTYFLEDVLQMTGHAIEPNADWARWRRKAAESTRRPANVPTQFLDDEHLNENEMARRYHRYDRGVLAALAALNHNAIDYDLVVQTVELALTMRPAERADGVNLAGGGLMDAILIFLPGLKEIETLFKALTDRPQFSRDPQRSWVMPLHGNLPHEDQAAVFRRPPSGVRKIVLSTNVAETSVTIDDVGFVIDTGRHKEMRYDPERRMSSLQDELAPRANLKQRRGRAGRVAPGVAFHLVTKHRHDVIAQSHQEPEVRRVALEQLVLRIRALPVYRQSGTSAAEVCSRLLEPPSSDAVAKAVEELVSLDAMTAATKTKCEDLTPLGVHLSTLPIDARLGKLILLGTIFGVTDESLVIAAALSTRSPFLSPHEDRSAGEQNRKRWAKRAGVSSDHIAVLAAYHEWDTMAGSKDDKYSFCRKNLLGAKTLQQMAGLKRQLLEALSHAGFVRKGLSVRAIEELGKTGSDGGGSDGVRLALAEPWTGSVPERFAERPSGSVEEAEEGQQRHLVGANDVDVVGRMRPGDAETSGREREERGRGRANEDGKDGRSGRSRSRSRRKKEKESKSHRGRHRKRRGRECDRREVRHDETIDGEEVMRTKQRASLLCSLLCAALYPQVATLHRPPLKHGQRRGDEEPPRVFVRDRESNIPEQVLVHPTSVNAKNSTYDTPYMVYHELVRTSKVFLRDTTPVPPLALILFGGGLQVGDVEFPVPGADAVIIVDSWIKCQMSAPAQRLLLEVRAALDGILKRKIRRPETPLTPAACRLLDAVVELVAEEVAAW